MRMLDQLRMKKDAIGRIGAEARAEARRLGNSSYYTDPQHPGLIVEERADGTKDVAPLDPGHSEDGKHAAE